MQKTNKKGQTLPCYVWSCGRTRTHTDAGCPAPSSEHRTAQSLLASQEGLELSRYQPNHGGRGSLVLRLCQLLSPKSNYSPWGSQSKDHPVLSGLSGYFLHHGLVEISLHWKISKLSWVRAGHECSDSHRQRPELCSRLHSCRPGPALRLLDISLGAASVTPEKFL